MGCIDEMFPFVDIIYPVSLWYPMCGVPKVCMEKVHDLCICLSDSGNHYCHRWAIEDLGEEWSESNRLTQMAEGKEGGVWTEETGE